MTIYQVFLDCVTDANWLTVEFQNARLDCLIQMVVIDICPEYSPGGMIKKNGMTTDQREAPSGEAIGWFHEARKAQARGIQR